MQRLGLMGCGHVAQTAHLWAIAHTRRLQLVAAYDPDPKRLQDLQSRVRNHDVKLFTDSEEFFNSGIDAVSVASAAPAHLQNVLDAARHGKHVLCEKPLAMTDLDAARMIDAMRSAKLKLFTGFCYRFSPCALRIRELVQSGAIGKVRSLRLVYVWNLHGKNETLPDGTAVPNGRRESRMLEGGPMVDCGVHQIDLARWWLNSDILTYSTSGAWVEDYEAPDHMYLHLYHACRAHTTVEMSFSYGHTVKDPLSHFSYHLIGTDGLIRYERESKIFELRTANGTLNMQWFDEKNFHGMYEAFAEALESGRVENLPTGQDGLIATHIARSATNQLIVNRNRMQPKII